MAKKHINKQVTNKAIKGTRIKTKEELVAFLNAYGVAKQLRFLASLLLPNGQKFKLRFNVDGETYTDMKYEISIGIPQYMIGRTKEEILVEAKWRLIHEVGHLLYTDNDAWNKFVDDFAAYMNQTHGISELIGKKFGHSIMNSLEDGREEHMSRLENPGHDAYITFGRGLWYFNNDIKIVQPGTEDIRELEDTLFCLASLSTMGCFPKSYADVYSAKPELYDMMRNLKPLINKFVNTDSLPNAIPIAWTIVYQLEDWMVDIMKRIPEPDMSKALDDSNKTAGAGGSTANGSYGSKGTPSTGVGTPNTGSGTSNPANQPSGNTDNSSSSNSQSGDAYEEPEEGATNTGEGGKIQRFNDDDDSEYDTDMNEIVEEALREQMNEIVEDEFDKVQQATWDDLLNGDNFQDEEDEGTINQEDIDAIRSYYNNMDPKKRGYDDWAVGFKTETSKYRPLEATADVKLEAKKLNKEFQKIFLNKAGFDSKNRKRGILNTNDLYKLKTRDYNIFEKKGNPKDTDYVFYILVDGSGSMGGQKFIKALRACSLLEESLKGIAPVKIVMFDYSGQKVRHRVIKDYKESDKGNKSWAFANHEYAGGANMDGFSIRVAGKELAKRSEKRKILFTLSDGQPAGPSGYYGDRGENDVSEAVMEVRNSGISVFNIFFASSKAEREENIPSFKYMYRNKGIIACSPDKIGSELLRIVKKELNN